MLSLRIPLDPAGDEGETLAPRHHLDQVAALATTAVAVGVLLYNVGSSLCSRRLPADAKNRYFADVSMAVSFAATADFPVAAYPVKHAGIPRRDPAFDAFRRELVDATEAAGLHCGSVLGTVPNTGLADVRLLVNRADDPGRALLLGAAFKVLGVAPYLLYWLAPLAFGVVLFWLAWELAACGHAVAAGVFSMLLALSTYTVDTLALDYSATGFYLTALLLVVPVATYAMRPPSRRTMPGVFGRAVLAGVLLAVSVLARGTALVVAPFLIVSLVLALRGVRAARRPPWIAAVLVCAAFLAPYAVGRTSVNHLVSRTSSKYGLDAPVQAHELWVSIWEGLGDFDRTKDHFWLDERAQAIVGKRLLGIPESERILRAAVLRDVKDDPLWFAAILLKRFAATVLQRKLWPWPPVSGMSIAPATAPNEGVIDSYYSLTATADSFGVGRFRFEVPIPLLLLPGLLLILRVLFPRRHGLPDAARSSTLVVSLLAAAAIALPIAVTTAGALEPQAFVFTYLLAAAFLAEAVVQSLRDRCSSASSGPR
jgi:hypothetical protein